MSSSPTLPITNTTQSVSSSKETEQLETQENVLTDTQKAQLSEIITQRRKRNTEKYKVAHERFLLEYSIKFDQIFDEIMRENPDLSPFEISKIVNSKLAEQAQVIHDAVGFSDPEDWTRLVSQPPMSSRSFSPSM
jgi:hypothetical protein